MGVFLPAYQNVIPQEKYEENTRENEVTPYSRTKEFLVDFDDHQRLRGRKGVLSHVRRCFGG